MFFSFYFPSYLLYVFVVINSFKSTICAEQDTGRRQNVTICGTATEEMSKETWPVHIKIPWIALIYLLTGIDPDQSIAGLILSPTMVITGADKFLSAGDKKVKFFARSHYTVRTNTTIFTSDITENMQISQITQIRIHPEYSGLFGRHEWQKALNDVALIHLKTPIVFDTQVHAICIPSVEQLNTFLQSWNKDGAGDIVLSGWRRHVAEVVSLRMAPSNESICKGFWFGNNYTKNYPFTNRLCANVSANNSHKSCVHAGAGYYGKLKSENRYFFLGRVNNFYSDNRTCTPLARYFLEHVSPSTIRWIENNQKCGPNKFTCNNGQCIPLDGTQCNRKAECSDSSDEDPIICRGYKYCNIYEFGCGIYGKCINQSLVCNGVVDCEEGEDEADCKTESGSSSTLLFTLLGAAAVIILVAIVAAIFFWKKMRLAQKKLRDLTDEEVAEFENGSLAVAANPQQRSHQLRVYANLPQQDGATTLRPEKFAWDGARYEIPKEQLIIDWENSLGSGMTGVVYKGIFEDSRDGNSSKTSHAVAVKTFKSSADVENFKALLSELKIMTRVGGHNNVVGLVGAYTREIKQRVLFIAVELCGLGDLEGFLKRNRNNFINIRTTETRTYEQNVWNDRYKNREVLAKKRTEFTMDHLIRWSHEIANGMQHLSSLSITHGDLATRNVLLTNEMTAKISDFGLARNLYESGIYVKKQNAPLPWRWMAVESLRDFEFSTNSDVWAYGVTLWEIYSLGGVPFPGLGWTTDFVTQLYNGLRMAKPSHASKEIYAQMLVCWENEPKRRPSFADLKNFFQNLSDLDISSETAL